MSTQSRRAERDSFEKHLCEFAPLRRRVSVAQGFTCLVPHFRPCLSAGYECSRQRKSPSATRFSYVLHPYSS